MSARLRMEARRRGTVGGNLRVERGSRSGRFPYPATVALVGALVAAALVTETAWGRLSADWLERVGFAPRDLWALELGRLFTSALVTHGPLVLAGAMVMTALSVALTERLVGPWRALAVFWGIHLATVVAVAVIVTPLHATLQSETTEALVLLRDVGPSAGYFGALAFALGVLEGRASRLVTAAVAAWILINLLGWVSLGAPLPQKPIADMAHAIAFAMGLALGGWGARTSELRPGRSDPSS